MSSGLLRGLDRKLGGLWSILDEELKSFSVTASGGVLINRAGEYIRENMTREEFESIRDEFQETCLKVLSAALGDDSVDVEIGCTCHFHRSKLEALRLSIERNDPWLQTFFSVVLYSNPNLQARFRLEPPDDSTRRLSRLMYLKQFIKMHVNQTPSTPLYRKFRDSLSPKLSSTLRLQTIKSGRLGRWGG